ncbi:hypothetical protein B0H34DRAFT_701074 [Crassisporium funariophilum]|nr:hypothetical protein B0H34DRAFT_701074 [Crassisporium funariophilum]
MHEQAVHHGQSCILSDVAVVAASARSEHWLTLTNIHPIHLPVSQNPRLSNRKKHTKPSFRHTKPSPTKRKPILPFRHTLKRLHPTLPNPTQPFRTRYEIDIPTTCH